MTKPTRSTSRGNGRAAFIARLDAIRAEIAGGDYLATVYARHADAIGITYRGFCKLVARYAEDAKPVARRPYGSGRSASTPTSAPLLPAPPRPAATPAFPGAPAHARHEPAHAPRRTFVYDGNPRADDIARLITGTDSGRKD